MTGKTYTYTFTDREREEFTDSLRRVLVLAGGMLRKAEACGPWLMGKFTERRRNAERILAMAEETGAVEIGRDDLVDLYSVTGDTGRDVRPWSAESGLIAVLNSIRDAWAASLLEG